MFGPRYHHNVSTLATDGLFIIQIAKPSLAIAPHRLYVETVLAATPTKKRPRNDKVCLDFTNGQSKEKHLLMVPRKASGKQSFKLLHKMAILATKPHVRNNW